MIEQIRIFIKAVGLKEHTRTALEHERKRSSISLSRSFRLGFKWKFDEPIQMRKKDVRDRGIKGKSYKLHAMAMTRGVLAFEHHQLYQN